MAPAIAIIGGGPCGLTLARLLERKGIDYIVYEKDESENSNPGGGSLDIHEEDGQLALREAGLFDEFKKHARYEDDVFVIYDVHGKRWTQLGNDGCDEQTPGGRPEIDRRALRKILLDSVPKEKICWKSALKSATVDESGSPVLEFEDGRTVSGFALVVGADGAWSKVRPVITQAVPKYAGKYYMESRISKDNTIYPAVAKMVGPGTATFLGGPKQVIVQRQGDASYRFYLSMAVPEDLAQSGIIDTSDTEAMRRHFLSPEYYGSWAEGVKDMIRHAEPFRRWPLYTLALEDINWTSVSGFTLVGDAAHVTVPNGDGVNCGMADARDLASKISEHGIVGRDRAVQEYEQAMFTRSRASMAGGFELWKLMSHPDGPGAFIKAIENGFGS